MPSDSLELDTAHMAIWWPYGARRIVLSDKKVFDLLREHLYRVSSNLAKSSGGISGGILLTIAGIWYLIVFFFYLWGVVRESAVVV